MTPHDELSPEARALIDGYLDDRLDEADVARLKDLIVADAHVRRAYVGVMSMLGGVHRFLQERPTLPTDIPQPAEAASVDSPNPAMPLLLDELSQAEPAAGSGWLSFFGPVQGLLFAVVVACGIGGWMWANHAGGPPAVPEIQEMQLAHLPFDVRLDSGTARLSLPNVGYVIVEGPAEFKVLDAKRARLSKGRIKMRVTQPAGRGFVVETPDGDITDLGTEFGLDVADGRETGLVVFEGAVDLRVAEARATDPARVERFVGGEGAVFNKEGRLDRIVSVVTGDQPTFKWPGDLHGANGVIANVSDNIHTSDTKKFYDIVPGGLNEDAPAYCDRPHQWNGVTTVGIPHYLLGADYVKTFNKDNGREGQVIRVTLSRPAVLYVFLDARAFVPEWLSENFVNTGDRIGLDADYSRQPQFRARSLSVGPGESIDEQFTVWKRIVRDAGVETLGGNPAAAIKTQGNLPPAMYGIAAVALDSGMAETHLVDPMVATASASSIEK